MWKVYMLQNTHAGHIQPMHPCQKGLLLSYAITKEVAEVSSAGATPAAIINFLTKNGQLGMLTAHKVEHIRQNVLSDLDTYTVRPKRNESAAQALLNMLACSALNGGAERAVNKLQSDRHTTACMLASRRSITKQIQQKPNTKRWKRLNFIRPPHPRNLSSRHVPLSSLPSAYVRVPLPFRLPSFHSPS